MFYYMFMPLNRHIDSGFGAMGDAFREAAEKLLSDKKNDSFNSNLPINFLLRHSIELYLKSLIIVIHRSLKLPFGDKTSIGTPSICLEGKWKPVHQVHSVNNLYKYFKKLVLDKKKQIQKIAKTDWSAIPPELDSWIEKIEKHDRISTLFRYPVTRDQEDDSDKSAWKEVSPDEFSDSLHTSEKATKSFVIVDDNHNVVSAYQYDDETMKELHEALKGAADLLSGAHCGMRVEIAGGK